MLDSLASPTAPLLQGAPPASLTASGDLRVVRHLVPMTSLASRSSRADVERWGTSYLANNLKDKAGRAEGASPSALQV